MNDSKFSNVAIVVIGKNEGVRLRRSLESVCKLNVPAVYVDSRSTDQSMEIATQQGVDCLELDESCPMNAARARNTGFAHIVERYPDIEYIQFLDGDSMLHESWLKTAVKEIESDMSISAVCGRLVEHNIENSVFRVLLDVEWRFPLGDIESCGGIALIRRTAFEKINGFNEALTAGEDPDLYKRLRGEGGKVRSLVEDMAIHDSGIDTFRQWWVRCVRSGCAFAAARKWNGFRKHERSAWLWGLLIPVSVVSIALLGHPFFMTLLLVYPAQIIRMYLNPRDSRLSSKVRWVYSTWLMLAKFPEVVGMCMWRFRTISAGRAEEKMD